MASEDPFLTCIELPPTLIDQWTHISRMPNAYFYFIGIGAFMVILTALLIMPRWYEFRKVGLQMREKQNLILEPFSLTAYKLIIFFPVYASILKYITFLHPLFEFTADFMIHSYEGIIFWLFGKLLVMYLGSIENLMRALNQVSPKKFYAVPPFACCLKPFCAAKNMKHSDFRLLYYFTLQYALLAPLLTYLLLLRTIRDELTGIWVLSIAEFGSSMLCVYGLFALMTAAHSILEKHKIHHKFWCIKLLVWFIVIPNLILVFVGPYWKGAIPGSNQYYDGHLMMENYITMIELVLFVILAYFFRKYFHPNDAVYAHKNEKYKSHNVQYSQVDVSDKVLNETEDSSENDEHHIGGITDKQYSITTTPGNTLRLKRINTDDVYSNSHVRIKDVFKLETNEQQSL